MRIIRLVAATPAVLAVSALAAVAQDHSGHAMDAASTLPDICRSASEAAAAMPPMAGDAAELGPAQQALMASMDVMHPAMMEGIMAGDPDVAVVCGMIPHHQGAIDMARIELEHGDDPFAQELARRVIAAQEGEIAEMIDWLEAQAE